MKIRYGKITKDVLLAVATAGVLTIACTSPYFLINLAKGIIRYKKYNKKSVNERSLARSLMGLNKNKIIILKTESDKFKVKLTEKGRGVIKDILFDEMRIEKQKIWDKKWRVVIFDIPEKKRKNMRGALRQKLKTIGFYQLQKSVWIHPHPCTKEIQLLCEIYMVNPYVNILTAEEIYNDDILMKHFKL